MNGSSFILSLGFLVLGGAMSACSGDASLGRNVESQNSKYGAPAGGAASAGAAGTAGSPAASGGSGGGAAPACEKAECLRAIECVAACGGPIVKSGCCPCDAGTYDRLVQCGSGGGGTGNGDSGTGTDANAGGASEASAQGGAKTSGPVTGLNTACVSDACPSGLTPVRFYGVAGKAGPEFCWCTIPCADDAEKCPAGTSCTTLSDGPGTVCVAR